jgi:hypothetical protein
VGQPLRSYRRHAARVVVFVCDRDGLLNAFVMQPQLSQQCDIPVGRRVLGREEFVAVEDRVCAGEKTKRLALTRNPGARCTCSIGVVNKCRSKSG